MSLPNRRKISRYHLLHPLAGFIEHGNIRHRGEVVELSTAGFRFRLPGTPKEAFLSHRGANDFGEIIYKNEEIGGFGEIRYVRAEGRDVLVGFKWDDDHADANIHRTFAIIAELIAQKSAGCANANNGVVEVAGHVSIALADDIRQALDPRQPRVSLKECTSIDASGVSLLAELEDAHVRLEGADNDVRALLHQFRMKGAASLLAIA